MGIKKQRLIERAYLRNYSVIGNSAECGIGRLLIRYKFAKFFNLKSQNIKSAHYNIMSLNPNIKQFELLTVLEDWCSLTGNWNDNYKTGDIASVIKSKNSVLAFDITNEVKRWCDEVTGQMEHNGLLLKYSYEKEGESDVILSNDNTLYRNVTEVILQ